MNTKRSLVLVRTPFQAWLVEQVLEAEKVPSFDLLYFTQNDSTEDRFYYKRLSPKACAAKYVFVPGQVRDVFNHIRFALSAWPLVLGKRYGTTIISSIDSYVLNGMANRRAGGELVTFDDGTANYNQAGVYFRDPPSRMSRLYRGLFQAKSITETRARIKRHYTIHPDLENIVEGDRLLSIAGWGCEQSEEKSTEKPRTFFIGAPFRETLDTEQIDLLESRAKEIGVDVYVRHPREREPLDLDAPFLEKQGRIAEEAILDDAGGRPIVLIGFLSSVMFNLVTCVQRRIILVPKETTQHSSLIEIAKGSGCEIIFLD